jgi:hypothetical protein
MESLKDELFGRPRRKWKDNIEMDLRKIWSEDADWIELTQKESNGRIF